MSKPAATRLKTAPGLACLLALAVLATPAAADVESVPIGIKFTHRAPGAAAVFLAGSFNGWDAQRHPMTDAGGGEWVLVMALKPGRHEYKFVVDGSWFADPGNPNSAPDSFGGTNSVVEVGADGGIVASAAPAAPPLGSLLHARLSFGGRYLGRYLAWRDRNGDPRFRLERPEQNIDLNFRIATSDVVDAYVRLRLDNTTNVSLNNVHAQLDEGSIDVHPGPFRVLGYWDMEALQLSDPLGSGGDVDLPGTIMDDHLPAGKGTVGLVVDGDPLGLRFEGFFADVHDADYYGDIDVYDNTGRDIYGARLSHRALGLEFGAPLLMERDLVWVEYTADETIDAVEDYYDRTGDDSDWFELDRLDLKVGLDLSRRWNDGRSRASVEWLYGVAEERFVTANRAGFNNTNGNIEIALSDRTRNTWFGALHHELRPGRRFFVEHTLVHESGGDPGEVSTEFVFQDQATADNRVYVAFGAARPERQTSYTDVVWIEEADRRRHELWVQRLGVEADFGSVGRTGPAGGAAAEATIWTVSTRNVLGDPADRFGRWELEAAWTDRDDDVLGLHGRSIEAILRGERGLTRRLSAVADLRWIDYDFDEAAGTFTAPWLGVRYRPEARLDVVLFYGVDPLDFGIDYDGRHVGRWAYRQRYLRDHDGAGELDAERSLADATVLGLRANMRF